MKHQADKKRSERSFEVGDVVWLKLQPYVQSSVASRTNYKLSFRYFGRFEIISRIGTVAYKLQLPADSTIHPVFHVSLLKKVTGTHILSSSFLPSSDKLMQEPKMVLDRRLKTRGNRVLHQLLIKWVGWPPELATWEDEHLMLPRLLSSTACGQAVSQDRGNVTPLDASRPTRAKRPSTKLNRPEWTK